jgi:hypothetical protein
MLIVRVLAKTNLADVRVMVFCLNQDADPLQQAARPTLIVLPD